MTITSQGPQRRTVPASLGPQGVWSPQHYPPIEPPESDLHQPEQGHSVPTVVVHHSELCRVGLVRLLSATRFPVTASGASLNEVANAATQDDKESVILVGLDEDVPELLDQICSLKAQHEHLRAIVLADRFNVDGLLGAVDAGADAYLLNKQLTIDLLVNALDLVCRGQIVLPQILIQPAKHSNGSHLEDGADGNATEGASVAAPAWAAGRLDARLSSREQLIARHLIRGASNKHIARDLNLAEATIKVHMKAILRKIGARNRTQAAIWAVNHLE